MLLRDMIVPGGTLLLHMNGNVLCQVVARRTMPIWHIPLTGPLPVDGAAAPSHDPPVRCWTEAARISSAHATPTVYRITRIVHGCDAPVFCLRTVLAVGPRVEAAACPVCDMGA